jgi:DNA helicase-2/ATP-dependent DNA helicase PcrA
MPLDLMEDLSRGNSWLSFARGSSAIEYEHGEYRKSHAASVGDSSGYRKEKKKFEGKTYDSVDSIAEFFKQRSQQLGNTGGSFVRGGSSAQSPKSKVQSPKSSSLPGSSSTSSSSSSSSSSGSSSSRSPLPIPPSPSSSASPSSSSDFVPGSYVKHAKYGRGLVLRREGVGDSLKLTVTFPGYGQKKLVEKYAGLEKA